MRDPGAPCSDGRNLHLKGEDLSVESGPMDTHNFQGKSLAIRLLRAEGWG